ncbi:MAG TPA: 6-phosphogluconolactonase [Thermoanaerobaculia bacterium]|jgi:6-phosphogluconolactonase|nr:6-phosphogluconolactonase [Thermoanaerobaculia bacterium]
MAELRTFDDLDELARAAVEEITRSAEEAIAARGWFTIALSGGNTPKPVYRLLAQEPRIDWDRVHVFWGDDRHVPPTHPGSNFGMAMDTLLSKVSIPLDNVHRMRTEKPDAERVAEEYAWTLRSEFDLEEGEWPRFDLVLMGIGADGHTASLFPGSEAVRERSRLVIAPWVSSLGTFRITLTAPVFNHAALALFLVSGEEKAEALRAVLAGVEGDFQPDRFPAQVIRPEEGKLLWLVDRAAARSLREVVG